MQITQSIDLNLSIDGIPPQLHMPQGDGGRIISASLWDGATIYSPPDGTMCMLRFRKPDGAGGLYDTAEDGTKINLANNVATIPVALQVLAVGGPVRCQVELYAPAAEGELLSANRLATFAFILFVAPSVYPDAEIISGDYINIVSEALKAALDEVVDGLNEHQPRINADGKWELWDATKNAYVATEYTAIGEDGVRGRGWYQHNVGMGESQGWMWASKADAPEWGEGDWLYNPTNGYVGLCTIRTDNADGSGSANITYKGTLKGTDGTTPHIGANGNWFLGETDTGVKAAAEAATHETAGIIKPSADFDITEDGTLSLYKALILFSTVVPDKVEKGATQTTATVEWTANKTPTSVTVEGESVSPDTTSKELTGLQITEEKEFTVVAADSRGSQTATAVMRFCNGVYTGAAAAPAAVDGTFIRTLTKTLQSYKTRTFTVNAAAGQYIWYACPAGYGTPVFNVGGFDGGFSKVSTLDYTNPSGYTESYQVWRSDNAGLGQTTVNVS